MAEPTPTSSEALEAAPFAAEESLALSQRAETAERQRDEYYELLKRAQADFENAHQRHRRERDQERQFAASALAKDLLGALDNLERALASAREGGDSGPLASGVALVHDQILDAMKRHGITVIDALHKPFDPHYHQAVTQIATDEHPPNTVTQVLQQGYAIHGRVLRPASVIISALPTSS